MNKEEAIKILNDYDINFERHTPEEVAEAFEMAIKAIKTIPSEDEKIIRIKKGTLKARTGRYVIHDVEWLKEHFNTTEAKIYGQTSEDCISRKATIEESNKYIEKAQSTGTKDDFISFQELIIKQLPSVTPQPKERTEERTETHECDCISRQAVLESLHSKFADGFDTDKWWNSMSVLHVINEVPSVNPQPKEEPKADKAQQPKTGHWEWVEQQLNKGKWVEYCYQNLSCSNCGYIAADTDIDEYKYCPNCGAKMQEAKKND